MVRTNTVRRNIPLSRFFFLSDMFSPSPRHVLRYPFYEASCPRRILPSWITGLAGSLPAGFPVRKQKYNKKSRQAKRLRDQDLTNWATRIRTLKMTESESVALPFGDSPSTQRDVLYNIVSISSSTFFIFYPIYILSIVLRQVFYSFLCQFL